METKEINKVEIDQRYDTIIVEKSEGDEILIGSKLFCGCCGKILAVTKEKLTFPFTTQDLHAAVEHKSYSSTIFGLRHQICGHTMFFLKKSYGFMKLKDYIEERNARRS